MALEKHDTTLVVVIFYRVILCSAAKYFNDNILIKFPDFVLGVVNIVSVVVIVISCNILYVVTYTGVNGFND